MSEDRQNVDTAAEPDEKGWEALRPAVKYPVAEGALDEAPAADSPQEDVQDTQPETQTGAFARIRAEAPGTAAEPDVATGAVPIAPARSKLGERGVGQRVRTYTSVSTGFIPLVREVHNAPKSPTLSALSRDARQKEQEEALAVAQSVEEAEATEAAKEKPRQKEYRTETTTSNKGVRVAADPDEVDIPKEYIDVPKPGKAEAVKVAPKAELIVLDKPPLLRLRSTIITLAVPILVIMIAVRAVASDAFLWLEYHRPGFPADAYGFDTAERMRLGSYGLNYVTNFAPRSYLESITTGTEHKSAFLPDEVGHMHDVKLVILYSTAAAVLMLILAFISSATLRERAPGVIRRSLFTGAWLTVGILGVLAAVGIFSWDWLFTTFHTTFFPQGNWQFHLNDTLIRLYPPQFWVDAAIAVAALSMLIVLLLMGYTWPTRYRKQVALRRSAERFAALQKADAQVQEAKQVSASQQASRSNG